MNVNDECTPLQNGEFEFSLYLSDGYPSSQKWKCKLDDFVFNAANN